MKTIGSLSEIESPRILASSLEPAEKIHYQNGREDTAWICRCDCGNYVAKSTNRLRFGKAISCGCVNKSHGEIITKQYLEEKGYIFEEQKKFKELKERGGALSYDFFLKDKRILIEYQGQQHYQPVKRFGGEAAFEKQKERDERKRNFSILYGYKLVEIPYTMKSKKAIYDFLNRELIDTIQERIIS